MKISADGMTDKLDRNTQKKRLRILMDVSRRKPDKLAKTVDDQVGRPHTELS